MGVETNPKLLNKRDILKAFGDRVSGITDKEEKMHLDLDSNLLKKPLVPADIADQYERVTIDQRIADSESKERKEKILFVKLLKSGTDPISLVITKQMYNSKDKTIFLLTVCKGNFEKKTDQIVSEGIQEDSDDFIGHIVMTISKDGMFNIPHRYVEPMYRGPQNKSNERISNILLSACDQIVKSYANKNQSPQSIQVETIQLDVMLWLNGHGYEPGTIEDQALFEQVYNADKTLSIGDDFIVFPVNVPEDQRTYEERNRAIEISFGKIISPDTIEKAKKKEAERVRKRIKNVCGSGN